jgi:hypothetical protein
MRKRIVAVLAHVGAALTLVIAICVPFFLFGAFTKAVAHAGLHVDATYSGGTVARTIERNGYQIAVYQPVWPRALQRIEPFVQIVFKPAEALPARVSEEIDLDGDGQPDVRVSFVVPADPHAPLRGDVTALNSKYLSLVNVGGDSFSRLVVRVDNQVIVRVPLNGASGSH